MSLFGPRGYVLELPYDHPTARRLCRLGVDPNGVVFVPDLNPDMVLWIQETSIDCGGKDDTVTVRFRPAAPFATWEGRLEVVRSIT